MTLRLLQLWQPLRDFWCALRSREESSPRLFGTRESLNFELGPDDRINVLVKSPNDGVLVAGRGAGEGGDRMENMVDVEWQF